MAAKKAINVCVIVLGDIGRSPRMQYHVKSLIQHNYNVDLVGYSESATIREIREDPNTKVHSLPIFPDLNLPNTLKYIFKTFWQILSLFVTLFNIRRPHYVLCQNPPAIPTLFVCYIYCMIMRSKLIIDWHNYTHTILALGCGSANRPIVKLAKWIESFFGSKSTSNFCVTKAMQEDLLNNWNIRATVLYDKPPLTFHPITLAKKHDLFMKLSNDYACFLPTRSYSYQADDNDLIPIEKTALTTKFSNGSVVYNANRPAILISSTSWTPDEDFGILLKALENYEVVANESSNTQKYPQILCIITGKGPLKESYLNKISLKVWKKVTIITPWLEIDDYPLMLAAADLGVCLHWSSSGLDLPMKVVDMFGCGLPVCAVNFKCLNELVRHEQNGFIFENSEELSEQILSWFLEFPNNISLVNIKEKFQQNLRQFQSLRWNENWNNTALPMFK